MVAKGLGLWDIAYSESGSSHLGDLVALMVWMVGGFGLLARTSVEDMRSFYRLDGVDMKLETKTKD